MVNLKRLKEHAKRKNKWMANFLGIDEPAYSRLEAKPEGLSLEQYLKLTTHFGDLSEYMQREDDVLYSAFNSDSYKGAQNPYKTLFSQRDMLLKVLKIGLDKPLPENLIPPKYLQWPQVKAVICSNARLPNLGVFGRSDCGKSHLLNTLLGQEILPAKFTPTTSITIQVVHDKFRPSWFNEKVVLMKQDYWRGTETGVQNHIHWGVDSSVEESDRYHNHWEKNCLYRGSYDVLSEFAIRPRFNLPDKKKQEITQIQSKAHTAIIFVDSPILEYCQLIDIPGFENITDAILETDSATDINAKRESEAAINSLTAIDMAVFLSPLIGSFNSNDRGMLSLIKRHFDSKYKEKRSISEIDEIIWVISQADPSRSNQTISETKEQIAGSLVYHFAGDRLANISEKNLAAQQAALVNKLNVFWSDSNERRQPLLENIENQLANKQPQLMSERTREAIKWIASLGEGYYQKKVNRWSGLIRNQKLASSTLKKELQIKDRRIAKINDSLQNVYHRIDEIKALSIRSIEISASEYIDVDNLEQILKEAYRDNAKEAKENSFGLVYEQLQSLVERETGKFSSEIDKLFKDLECQEVELSIGSLNQPEELQDIEIPNDIKGAKAAGASSAITAGMISAAALSMGNLGGYALAAKGVGILSSLGVSFSATGGTAGVMTAISAAGGPITLGALITASVGLATWRLLGEKWERRLANKLNKLCSEKDLIQQFITTTTLSFELLHTRAEDQGAFLNSQYLSYLQELQDLIDGTLTVEELESLAKICMDKRVFFRSILFSYDT